MRLKTALLVFMCALFVFVFVACVVEGDISDFFSDYPPAASAGRRVHTTQLLTEKNSSLPPGVNDVRFTGDSRRFSNFNPGVFLFYFLTVVGTNYSLHI